MAYQVFARKYRPQIFSEVVGQEPIIRALENAIELNRVAQAYLFVGPRGTGKTSLARILAKALNNSRGPCVEFDVEEPICQEIAQGHCLDVLEIDGASNNGVEQVRDLRDNIRYTPIKGRFKVYIIDEVHMLTGAAFNALLKTLEEPPAHVKFIFATTEVHKMPATILSRCQRFDLRRIPERAIAEQLSKICEKEGVEAESSALAALARYAEGGLRDAESALDQVINFFGTHVQEKEVLTLFGLVGFEPVSHLAEALAKGDTLECLRLSREFIEGGKDLGKLSQDLLGFFRNLALYHIAPESLHDEVQASEREALERVAPHLSQASVLAILEDLSQLEARLRYALAKEVLFEVALIQLSQLKEKVSLESLLRQMAPAASSPQEKVRFQEKAPFREKAPPSPIHPKPPSPPEEKPQASIQPIAQPGEKFKQALEALAEQRPLQEEWIRSVQMLKCKVNMFEIGVPVGKGREITWFKSPRNRPLFQSLLEKECGQPVEMVFIEVESKEDALLEDPSASPQEDSVSPAISTEKPSPLSQEAFENDPLIQKAMELFEAKIMEKEKVAS